MNEQQLVKQLEEIKKGIAGVINSSGLFDALGDTITAIETIKDPDNALKKAREEAEHWRKKYLSDHEVLERFRSNRPEVDEIYGDLENPICELSYIACAWLEASDNNVLCYLAGQMANKAEEIKEIYYGRDEDEDEDEESAPLKMAA